MPLKEARSRPARGKGRGWVREGKGCRRKRPSCQCGGGRGWDESESREDLPARWSEWAWVKK